MGPVSQPGVMLNLNDSTCFTHYLRSNRCEGKQRKVQVLNPLSNSALAFKFLALHSLLTNLEIQCGLSLKPDSTVPSFPYTVHDPSLTGCFTYGKSYPIFIIYGRHSRTGVHNELYMHTNDLQPYPPKHCPRYSATVHCF